MWQRLILAINAFFSQDKVDDHRYCDGDCESLEDQISMVKMPDDIGLEEAKKFIASYSLEAWANFHEGSHIPFSDMESQIIATKYAVDEAVDLAPAIWRVCNQITSAHNFIEPPAWALVIARTAVIEYLTGNLRLLNEQTLKEMEDNEN